MAMQYAGDVCFISGKFKDAQGQEKPRYVKCGAYFQSGDRTGIKLEFIPVGFDTSRGLWFSLFPKRDEQKSNNQQSQGTSNQGNKQQNQNNGYTQNPDEVPF